MKRKKKGKKDEVWVRRNKRWTEKYYFLKAYSVVLEKREMPRSLKSVVVPTVSGILVINNRHERERGGE